MGPKILITKPFDLTLMRAKAINSAIDTFVVVESIEEKDEALIELLSEGQRISITQHKTGVTYPSQGPEITKGFVIPFGENLRAVLVLAP